MNKILNSSVAVVVLMVLLNIAMSIGVGQLTKQGISGAEVLFIRAALNLFLALAIAAVNNKSVMPKQPKLQIGAFICIGLSLLLIFTSYQYISAGSVSTLQRLDIPLLALIGVFSYRFSGRRFVLSTLVMLSVLAFVLVAILVGLSQNTNENPLGYLLVLSAVLIVAINTLLQKKIAIAENIETIMVVVSLSSVFWGGISCWQSGATFNDINLMVLLAIFGLALVNLAVFYLVNALYKKHSVEYVRYPYLIAAFGTMCVEMLIQQKLFSPLLIGGNVAILVVLTLLVRIRQKQTEKASMPIT